MPTYEPDIAALFHRHSSYVEEMWPESGDADDDTGGATTYPGTARIDLPGQGARIEMSLGEALATRRSVRHFTGDRLGLEPLGALLWASFGVSMREPPSRDEPVERRASPSAGGLYPLELHVLTRNTAGLADGLYHYDPRSHQLEVRHVGSRHDELAAATLQGPVLSAANAVVTVVGVPGRTMAKYGQRGYRFMLLDAGHLAQNLCLAAAALELGALPIGGFYDGRLHRLLELESGELPLYLVGLGLTGLGLTGRRLSTPGLTGPGHTGPWQRAAAEPQP
jgi:SagB-type dehydrogenase family enzyme